MGSGMSKSKSKQGKRSYTVSETSAANIIPRAVSPEPLSPVVVAIPAREVFNPTISGYLDRLEPGGNWKSCWYVLKDSTLYRYAAPIDDMTENVIQLPGYTMNMNETLLTRNNPRQNQQSSDKTFILTLKHQDFPSEIVSAEDEVECETWRKQLDAATRKLSVESVTLNNNTSNSQFDDVNSEGSDELCKEALQARKQQLLKEVLKQKEEIERKHALRMNQNGNVGEHDNIYLSSSSLHHISNSNGMLDQSDLATLQAEKALKQAIMIKQRKISTQLKVQSLQKQLQQLTEKRKEQQKRQKFRRRGNNLSCSVKELEYNGNTIMPPIPDEDHIHSQLNHLTAELHALDQNLDKVQKSAVVPLGSTTPEMLLSLEKRRHFVHKKNSNSMKSFESTSSEGGDISSTSLSVDTNPNKHYERKTIKTVTRKISKTTLGSSLLFNKKGTNEKGALFEGNLHTNTNGVVHRPPWEEPWTQSWDASRNLELCTRSTSDLRPMSRSQVVQLKNRKNHIIHQSCDLTELQRQPNGLKVSPNSSLDLNDNITMEGTGDQSKITPQRKLSHHRSCEILRANRETSLPNSRRIDRPKLVERPTSMTASSGSEINPAALAEIAAFEELFREKMGNAT